MKNITKDAGGRTMKKTKLLDVFEQNLEDRMDEARSMTGEERLRIEEKMKSFSDSDNNKQSITIRLDKDLLEAIKKEAIAQKLGYQTLMSIELRKRFVEKRRPNDKAANGSVFVYRNVKRVAEETKSLKMIEDQKELLNLILKNNLAVLNRLKELSKDFKVDHSRKASIRKTVHHKVKAKAK